MAELHGPHGPLWHWAAEHALCLSLPGLAQPASQRRLLALAEQLRGTPGLLDAVPGVHSLTLVADLELLQADELQALAGKAWRQLRAPQAPQRQVELKVRYGGSDGPDLPEAAARLGLSQAAFIEAHTTPSYEVACLGFLPGFPYLLGLPEALHLPRRERPRLKVPAGSVGIGGAQTGVYPMASPGGWWLIGRTDRLLFDAARQPPCLLQPGDQLRFVPL